MVRMLVTSPECVLFPMMRTRKGRNDGGIAIESARGRRSHVGEISGNGRGDYGYMAPARGPLSVQVETWLARVVSLPSVLW